jgi:hypothetical protein
LCPPQLQVACRSSLPLLPLSTPSPRTNNTHLSLEVRLVEGLDADELLFALVGNGAVKLATHNDVDVSVIVQLPLAVPAIQKEAATR